MAAPSKSLFDRKISFAAWRGLAYWGVGPGKLWQNLP
jgi:hypothetical protein